MADYTIPEPIEFTNKGVRTSEKMRQIMRDGAFTLRVETCLLLFSKRILEDIKQGLVANADPTLQPLEDLVIGVSNNPAIRKELAKKIISAGVGFQDFFNEADVFDHTSISDDTINGFIQGLINDNQIVKIFFT